MFGPAATRDGVLLFGRRMEALGYHSLWVSDHVVVPNANVANFGEAIFDPFITLAVAAGATSRVKLGTTVLIVPYRNAIVTAKMVSSLDALSGGRVILGIGAGWVAAESAMLTGDLNVAVVEWVVQYKIKDPVRYLFHVREPLSTFRDMSEAVMRQVVGDHSVDEVITIGRESIALEAKQQLQELCNLYGIGIEVQQLVLQDVNPPEPVKPAFNEVNQAIQEKERAINDAWADYNKSVPKAKGEADQAIRSAEGYALERVNKAEGDASRFNALYEEYRKAPVVTRKRIYLETLAQVLPRIERKVVLDDKAKGFLPLLQLEGGTREIKP